jgi:hypothetical protein
VIRMDPQRDLQSAQNPGVLLSVMSSRDSQRCLTVLGRDMRV